MEEARCRNQEVDSDVVLKVLGGSAKRNNDTELRGDIRQHNNRSFLCHFRKRVVVEIAKQNTSSSWWIFNSHEKILTRMEWNMEKFFCYRKNERCAKSGHGWWGTIASTELECRKASWIPWQSRPLLCRNYQRDLQDIPTDLCRQRLPINSN